MIRLALTLCLAVALASGAVRAQDIHFTQFYASPLLLNPALTGGFAGQVRASGIYRDQWRGALESPFTTVTAALDFRFPFGQKSTLSGDAASAGIVFLNDRVREYNFTHNQIMVSGAYHKTIDDRTNQILSAGFQFGIGQRNINYGNLSFQDQFAVRDNADGSVSGGYFGATGEDLPQNNIAFVDVSAGINYSYAPANRPALYAGLAAHHLNRPDISFYTRDFNAAIEDVPEEALLDTKFTAHVAGVVPLDATLSLMPRFLGQVQGESAQAVLGSNVRYKFDAFSSTAFHVGVWGRGVRQVDGFGADAVIGLVGVEYRDVLIGTSYDFGVSDFTAGSRGRGALEISIAYLGNYSGDELLCPKF